MEILSRGTHPGAVRAGLRNGTLTRILPGIHGAELDPVTLCRAITRADPDAIVLGLGARWLGWRPDLPPDRLVVASRRRLRSSHVTTVERTIPLEFVRENELVRFTTPEFTAVDLIPELGAEVVDDVLRAAGERHSGQALELMWGALAAMPGRRGNRYRRMILHDSRDRPWSAAERRVHRLLREAGIGGWRTNHPVQTAGGRYLVDLAFPAARVAVEVDGWQFHRSFEAFTRDRTRSNDLQVAGWIVLRVTWAQIDTDLLTWLRPALRARR